MIQTMAIKTKPIIALFLNLLFALGVIILIFGFINSLRFGAYTIVFDDYPLNQYEEDCAYLRGPIEISPDGKPVNPEASEKLEQDCEQKITRRRQIKQVNDLTTSLGLLISGLFLIYLFNPKSRLTSAYL